MGLVRDSNPKVVAMEITVFYAWQGAPDAKVDGSFIQEAVEKALKRITNDASLDFSLKLDHDTKDVPGMPEITTTILKKIEESHIFLADLTFVATTEAEKPEEKAKYLPNPNVLFQVRVHLQGVGFGANNLCNEHRFRQCRSSNFRFSSPAMARPL